MQSPRSRRRLVCTLTALALCLGAFQTGYANAAASKIYDIFFVHIKVPSVKKNGHLSHISGKIVKCKIVKNHKTGKCVAICHGTVKNFSGKWQKYFNIGLVPPRKSKDCSWKHDFYTVTQEAHHRGKCRGIAWGVHKSKNDKGGHGDGKPS